jgi:hypothetical protein
MRHTEPAPASAILRMFLPALEAEGFRIMLHPDRSVLPPFMQGYQPDAIAVMGDRKIAIELKSDVGRRNEDQIHRLRALFSGHPDWEFRVFYAPPTAPEVDVKVPSIRLVTDILEQLPRLYEEAGPVPALLTGWSAFEAAARALEPDRLGRPQTSGRLLEILAADGYITPDEADLLRSVARVRNSVAHGDLDVSIDRQQLENLILVTRTLLDLRQVIA